MHRTWTRREFFEAVSAAGAVGVSSSALAQSGDTLPITVAGYPYDRVAALMDGRVSVEGCDVNFEKDAVGNMNTHIFSGPGTREVTEIGLHPFMLAYANDAFRDYTLLPIFPLRVFRHKSVFIRTDRGIESPADLRGKKVGTPGYSSTSLTWIRGIFEDDYGLKPSDVEWVVSRADSTRKTSGGASAQENVHPEGVTITEGPAGVDESELLVSGVVDALFHAIEPRAYTQGNPVVARLFPDSRAVERDYYERTGIYPIMHAVAIRAETVRKHPWLPRAVFDAYVAAKKTGYAGQTLESLGFDLLPWYGYELEQTRKLMGANFYPYGIEPNRKNLETLFRYSHRQGLASRELKIEELFLEESLSFSEPG